MRCLQKCEAAENKEMKGKQRSEYWTLHIEKDFC